MVKTIKVLMVEGDAEEIHSLEEALTVGQIVSVEVREVEDGEQALAYLRQEYPFFDAPRPDLILLNSHLPEMSGFEVLEEIKQDRALQNIPIAILTASQNDSTLGKHYDETRNCYTFQKPKSCDQWLYVLRCIEDVWLTITKLTGQKN